ncbi:MAG TPA: TonB-dependent receptor, partial [Bacteroidales bacterium]
MNFKIPLLALLLLLFGAKMRAQTISGNVYEMQEGKKVPLAGTNIYQLNTTNGTTSNEQGQFTLKIKQTGHEMLVFSYVGYVNDTIHVHDSRNKKIEVVMRDQTQLGQVEIVSSQRGNYVSRASTLSVETVSSAGLKQAACCNLSESFENSASVNVNYSDAITGAKHIEMLGLAGKYTVFMQENIPNLRGLAGPFGLGYYPGDWMQSIQVSKGASTVVNGYESITGQINIELKKPSTTEIFFLNMYINSEMRLEANAVGTIKLNDKWTSMLFGHYDQMQMKIDDNGDGFLDMPLMRQVNIYNRWTYEANGTHFEFGMKYLNENREGGQDNYNPELVSNPENGYGFGVKTNRAEANIKLGHVFSSRDLTSLG